VIRLPPRKSNNQLTFVTDASKATLHAHTGRRRGGNAHNRLPIIERKERKKKEKSRRRKKKRDKGRKASAQTWNLSSALFFLTLVALT
jgi:hypothetical protein